MQYIRKQNNPPNEWDSWFSDSVGKRCYDYKTDATKLLNLYKAKDFLINEQCGLCAYCQQKITSENSSIEHVIPKSQNIELSTNYHNLVAVCKKQLIDANGNLHCDSTKADTLIVPLIFSNAAQASEISNHPLFEAHQDGTIAAKPKLPNEQRFQIEAFITILNLNHSVLKQKRSEALDPYIETYSELKPKKNCEAPTYLERQVYRFVRDEKQSFRQFILIWLLNKLGKN